MAMFFNNVINGARIDIAQYYLSGRTFDVPAATNALTICGWIQPTDFGADVGNAGRILCKATDGTADTTIWYCIDHVTSNSAQRMRARLRTGSPGTTTSLITANHKLVLNTVYFFVFTYDGVNMKLFINNGIEIASVAKTGSVSISATTPMYIGDSPNTRRIYRGYIDDLRMYTRALSVSEMQTIYFNDSTDNIVFGLYARWLLREKDSNERSTSDAAFKDLSETKKNGSEDSGTCLTFNSSLSQCVNLATVNADLRVVAPFTIECWVKPTTSTGVKRFFGTRNGSNGVGFGQNGLGLILTTYGRRDWNSTANRLTVGIWQHVAVVFMNPGVGRQVLFYVNGVLTDTITDNAAANPATTLVGAQIGADGNSTEYFDGSISHLKVYKGEQRTVANILLYKDELPPSSANLKVYIRFFEGQGTSAADSSGFTHTGTTVNSPIWEDSGAMGYPVHADPITHLTWSADAWLSGISYIVNDTCEYFGNLYTCILNHTSSIGNEPPTATTLWSLTA